MTEITIFAGFIQQDSKNISKTILKLSAINCGESSILKE
jgi:hypothetical protein